MKTLNQRQNKVSRRSFTFGTGAVALSSASPLKSAHAHSHSAQRSDEYSRSEATCKLTARIVAVQVAPGDKGRALPPSQALSLITSQIGSVDLVAFHPAAQTMLWDDLAELSSEANKHSCYVALGVAQLNHTEWSHTLIGPNGYVVGSGLMFEDVVCETDLGLVALSSGVNPQFEFAPDILVHSPSDEVMEARPGSYTIRLTNHVSNAGSAIYAPDGKSMTRTGVGWTQGLVASVNLSALRHSRLLYNGDHV